MKKNKWEVHGYYFDVQKSWIMYIYKCGNIVLHKYHSNMTVYMYGKKNKIKNKNYSRNNVILSLWSRSVGIYDFRVDKML